MPIALSGLIFHASAATPMARVSSFSKKKIDAYLRAVKDLWSSAGEENRRNFVESINWQEVASVTAGSDEIDTWAFAAFVYEALDQDEQVVFDEIMANR